MVVPDTPVSCCWHGISIWGDAAAPSGSGGASDMPASCQEDGSYTLSFIFIDSS
jgi:hypothetical protein